VAGAAWWGYQKWQESHGDQAIHPSAASSETDANEIIPGSTS